MSAILAQLPPDITSDQLSALIEAAQTNQSGAVLIMSVVLGIGALRLAEAAVARFLPGSWGGKRPQHCGFSSHDVHKLRELHDWHARFGADGQPLWYSKDDPKLLEAVATSLQSVAEVQRDTLRIVERLERRLETK